jgi:hypothetical protein
MDNYKHVISGGVSGISQVLVGYPFDTLKVWKQVNIKPIYNISNLYRGIYIPLLSNGIINSCLFSINNKTNKIINNNFFSGLFSGFITSPLLNMESYQKIKYQNNVKKKINIFNGLKIGFLRNSLFYGIYFESYFKTKELLNNKFSKYKFTNNLIAGGISGCLSWLSIYPLDTIRTRLQTNNITLKDAINQRYLYNGLKIAMVRAFIVNSIGFYFYELTLINL